MSKQLNYTFSGELQEFINKAIQGKEEDIQFLFNQLDDQCTLAITRYVDYALSLVTNIEGIKTIEFFLFNGTLIQRNYASLFLNRRGDWKIVVQAYHMGLIDEIQAYAR